LFSTNVQRALLKPAVQSVGLGWVSFHNFRHTCASLLFEAGRNVKQVSEWLGHADPAFTLRTYIHLMDARVGDAAFLDDAVTADPAQVKPGSSAGAQADRWPSRPDA
jgi:integrase